MNACALLPASVMVVEAVHDGPRLQPHRIGADAVCPVALIRAGGGASLHRVRK